MTLQTNATLQGGKYIIKKVLGQGGFGITYLAENTMLDGKVAIKEFFMKELCERNESTSNVTLGTSGNHETVEKCRQKFLKEARTIFKLNHPNIVRILDVFEENGTAYYVMEYIHGESLADMVKRHGTIPEAEAVGYVKEVGDALKYIHDRKLNHLDIKPSNIMRREEDRRIMLIDFGVSKQYDLVTSEGTSTTPVGISRGYSPAEQYHQHGVQTFSPQSDVYALAATLFKLLTGVTPPEAMEIQDEGLPTVELQSRHISAPVIAAIQRAMKGKRERTQSVEAFLYDLEALTVDDEEETKLSICNEDNIKEDKKGSEDSTFDNSFGSEINREIQSEFETHNEFIGSHPKQINSSLATATPKSSSTFKIILGVVAVAIVVVFVMFLGGMRDSVSTVYSNGVLNYNDVQYKMVHLDGGTFTMGATSEQGLDVYDDEMPAHQVTLSSFSIGETEVTQELWQAVMGSNPSIFKGNKRPVENVSKNDCLNFIKKLNSATGKTFRLPTEAEWEFAARGGNKSQGFKYSGSDNIGDVAWYKDNSEQETHDVATKQPNEVGLYDMSGNVNECCSDLYGEYKRDSQTNPKGPIHGRFYVIRGGGCIFPDYGCRSSWRGKYAHGYTTTYHGLRLALTE